MTPRSNRNRGYALIELMAVITVITVVLGLCAGMIHQLMKLDRVGRDAMDESTDMARMADDFRGDVHASEPDAVGVDRCVLKLPEGQTVEYQVLEREVSRTIRQGEKTRHRESYRRPRGTTIRIERSEGYLIIRLDRDASDKGSALYQDFRIEAEIGRNGRLSRGGKS